MSDFEKTLARMESSSRKPRVRLGATGGRSTVRPKPRRTSSGSQQRSDQVLEFEIYGEDHPNVISGDRKPDDMLVAQIKREINASGITRADLYSFVGDGEGCLFKNENQAYNLEYGLRQRPSISLECARRWLAIFGKDMVIVFQNKENGWFDNMVDVSTKLASDTLETVPEAESFLPGPNDISI